MKNIFITGISGMLGSNMAYILRNKYNVYGVDLNETSIEGVNSVVGSIFDLDKIKDTLTKNNIDTFIHCAALVNVDECEEHPEYADSLNYDITKKLASVCYKLKIKFVFMQITVTKI